MYDFHEDGDSDEREPSGLMIDETPRRKGVRTQSQEPLKIKLSCECQYHTPFLFVIYSVDFYK